MEERGGGVAPALGLAWASLVTSRITLSRDETVHSNLDCCKVPTAVKRELEVVFAPHLPPVSVDYYVTSAGIHGNQNMANCCPAT
ncbi:DNA repair protein XRCC3 homolog [Geodia barretti]|nr:DNA repair protein XRCC3 homolog [Geodia barretti]